MRINIVTEDDEQIMYHSDCPSPSTMKGGLIKPASGICGDCHQEMSKTEVTGGLSKTLRNQLRERFEPTEGDQSNVVRNEVPRRIDYGNVDKTGTDFSKSDK